VRTPEVRLGRALIPAFRAERTLFCFVTWCGSSLALRGSPAAWWPCCLTGSVSSRSSTYLILTSRKCECSGSRSWCKCSPQQLLDSVRLTRSQTERTAALVRQGVLRAGAARASPPPLRPRTRCLGPQCTAGCQAGPPAWGCHLLTSHQLSEVWSCVTWNDT